jgi:hypothetical protein
MKSSGRERADHAKSFLLLAAGVAVLLAAGGCRTPGDRMLPVVQEHLQRYPAMQVEDIYKLAHQAAFGNGHLITDEAGARAYLQSEFDSVTADAAAPLVEALSPDGSVVRVNLRPFKARGGDLRALGDAMLASAPRLRPQPASFDRWWQEIVDAAAAGAVPFDAAALRSFGAARKAEGYPAIHHSAEYESRYHPAYRVVLRTLASGAIGH